MNGPECLFPYVCFACRKCFRRRVNLSLQRGFPDKVCPHCGGKAMGLSRKFKPPAVDDIKQWKKVAFLVENGFLFDQAGEYVPYPATLAEAKVFVKRYGRKQKLAKSG